MATETAQGARQRMPRAERARQLLGVAEEVFTEQGVQAASMDDIAARGGVTKPILYDHFGSKDGLLAAVIERAGLELHEATRAAAAAARTPEDALARGLRAYFEFIARHGRGWAALLAGGALARGPAAAAIEEIRARQAELIAAVIETEIPSCDHHRALVYANAIVGACERLSQIAASDPSLTPAELGASLTELVWSGFRGILERDRPRGRK